MLRTRFTASLRICRASSVRHPPRLNPQNGCDVLQVVFDAVMDLLNDGGLDIQLALLLDSVSGVVQQDQDARPLPVLHAV